MELTVLMELQASLLYLLPVLIVLVGRARRNWQLQELALWIPATLAFDLFTATLLAMVVPWDAAILVSRAGWVLFGGAWLFKNRREIARPSWFDVRHLGVLFAATAVVSGGSIWMSRAYSIWDRQFHIPIVNAIRGQSIPFRTPFQPGVILHYHFGGNAIAAALQTLSMGRIHASLGIALVHNIMFGLFALCLAGWLIPLCRKRAWIVPATAAAILGGPASILRKDLGSDVAGYNFHSLLHVTFRVSASVAIVFLLGGIASIALRLSERPPSYFSTAAALLLSVVGLSLTDETSGGLLCLGLGLTWLVHPDVVWPTRKGGVLILVGLAIALVGPSLLFSASLAPGGPIQTIRVISWRSPGLGDPPLDLDTVRGAWALFADLAPFLLVQIAVLGVALRNPSKSAWALAIFCGAVLLAGSLFLTRLDINGHNYECQRFMVASELLFPVIAVVVLPRLTSGSWERLPLLGALFLGTASTFRWCMFGIGEPYDLFTNPVDCRESANARLFEKVTPTYIPHGAFYKYAGCHAVMFPGRPNDWDTLWTGGPEEGRKAFAALHRSFVPRSEPLMAACPAGSDADPVCSYARAHQRCRPWGSDFERCRLSPEDRNELLAGPSW